MNRFHELIAGGLAEIGLPSGPDAVDRLARLAAEVERFKVKRFVDAEGERLVIRHILDCAAALPYIMGLCPTGPETDREPFRIADLGSGAGFPGLVLAVFLPVTTVSLIESSAARASFLKNAAVLMGLNNVDVVNARIEDCRGRYDLLTWRAFKPLKAIEDAVLPLLKEGGTIAAFKGRKTSVDEELGESSTVWRDIEITPLSVPYLDAERNLLVLRPQ